MPFSAFFHHIPSQPTLTEATLVPLTKWEDDLTNEEIAQSDDNISQICNEIINVCQRKNLNDTLTRFAVGVASCNIDKGQLIAEWIGKIRKTNYTLEAWGKRLEMLVG